jgi:hypoxanthine-guanine phosphoribosyltransferase
MGLKLNDILAAERLPMQLEEEAHEKMRKVLDVLCAIVADVTGASSVMIAKRNPLRKTIQVRGSIGTMIKELDMSFAIPALDPVKSPSIAVPDVRLDPRFVNHPMAKLAPHIRSFIAVMLPGFDQHERAVLHIVNPKRAVFGDATIWRELSSFTTVFAGVLGFEKDMILIKATEPDRNELQDVLAPLGEPTFNKPSSSSLRSSMSGESSIDFLFDTLIKKRTLHSRNGVNYLTLRNWRAQVKAYQISTLVSLKSSKPEAFIRRAASEITEAVRQVHGEGVIGAVVPVPPGSSGDANSFAVMLAREVAADLNVPFCDVLEPQGQKGKSAPIKSAKLKPYVVKEKLAGPILVVDDVASSGAHMELAMTALKQHAKAVYGIVWIGK